MSRGRRKVGGGLDAAADADFHSLVAETQLLGCCLLDEHGGYAVRAQMAGIEERAFFSANHRWFWRVICQLLSSGQPVDTAAVGLAMRAEDPDGYFKNVMVLEKTADAARSALGFKQALAEVLHLWRARQGMRALIGAADAMREKCGDWGAFYEAVEETAGTLAGLRPRTEEDAPAQVVARSRAILERKMAGQEDTSRWIYLGLPPFDNKQGALDWENEDWLVVLAAAPSTGKSALARSCFVNTSLARELTVAAFLLETSRGMYMRLLAATRAQVNLRDVGRLPKSHEERLMAEHDWVGQQLMDGRLWLFDDVYFLETIKLRVREVKRARSGLDLVVVDYLQMVQVADESLKRGTREQVVAHISRELKLLAKEIGCPVLALAQLNREMRKGEVKRRPRTSDLRESGAIEQDADCIMTLFIPDEDMRGARQTDDQLRVYMELSVLKRRNGPLGMTKLWFDREWTRFVPVHAEDQKRSGGQPWLEDPHAAPDESEDDLPQPGDRRR